MTCGSVHQQFVKQAVVYRYWKIPTDILTVRALYCMYGFPVSEVKDEEIKFSDYIV